MTKTCNYPNCDWRVEERHKEKSRSLAKYLLEHIRENHEGYFFFEVE